MLRCSYRLWCCLGSSRTRRSPGTQGTSSVFPADKLCDSSHERSTDAERNCFRRPAPLPSTCALRMISEFRLYEACVFFSLRSFLQTSTAFTIFSSRQLSHLSGFIRNFPVRWFNNRSEILPVHSKSCMNLLVRLLLIKSCRRNLRTCV